MTATLVTFSRKGVRREFALNGGTLIIGRRDDADIRIPVEEVSRAHCEVTLANGRIQIKDLKSSNGTFVNDQQVTASALKAGDRLRVGPVTFTLQVDGVPKEIRPGGANGQAKAAAKATAETPTSIGSKPSKATTDSASDLDIDELEELGSDDLSDFDIDDIGEISDSGLIEEIDKVEEVDVDELESDPDIKKRKK